MCGVLRPVSPCCRSWCACSSRVALALCDASGPYCTPPQLGDGCSKTSPRKTVLRLSAVGSDWKWVMKKRRFGIDFRVVQFAILMAAFIILRSDPEFFRWLFG